MVLPLNQASAAMVNFGHSSKETFYWNPDSVSPTNTEGIVKVETFMQNLDASNGGAIGTATLLIDLNEKRIKLIENNYFNLSAGKFANSHEGDGKVNSSWKNIIENTPLETLYNAVVSYVAIHQSELKFQKDVNKAVASTTPTNQTSVSPLVQPKIKTIQSLQISWIHYQTINLTAGKSITLNLPAVKWRIIPTLKTTQFSMESDNYINRTGEYDNELSGCIPGTYTITPSTSGEIKIMIGK